MTIETFAPFENDKARARKLNDLAERPGYSGSIRKAVLFGDSYAAPGDSVSPANQDVSIASSSAWQSGLVTLSQLQNKWMTPSFYPQLHLVGNGGIAGQTTTQILARDVAAAGITRRAVKDMIDLSPDVAIFRGGSINNLQTITTAGQRDAAVTTAISEHRDAVGRFITAGIPVLDVGIYGYSGSPPSSPYSGDPALIREALVAINAAASVFAAQNSSMVKYVSPSGIVSDSAGNFYTNRAGVLASDVGVHLNNYGAYLMAQREAAALAEWFGSPINSRYRGINTVVDPLFVNNTAGGFGTVNNNITFTPATNCTRQNAKIETINGKRFQTCELLITGAANSITINLPYNPTATGLNVATNDVYGIEIDLYIAGLNGFTPNVNDELIRLDTRDNVGSGRILIELGGGVYPFVVEKPMQRHLIFPPLKFGDAAANLTTASTWSIRIGTADASGTYKVGVANPRIVKLDQALKNI